MKLQRGISLFDTFIFSDWARPSCLLSQRYYCKNTRPANDVQVPGSSFDFPDNYCAGSQQNAHPYRYLKPEYLKIRVSTKVITEYRVAFFFWKLSVIIDMIRWKSLAPGECSVCTEVLVWQPTSEPSFVQVPIYSRSYSVFSISIFLRSLNSY